MITNSLNDYYAKKTVKTSGKHFAKKLYDKGLNSLPSGKHSDGDGLYFIHKADGRKYWAYLFTWHGKAREMFLDKYPALSLANAWARTLEYRAMVKNNIDPIEERKQGRVKVNTFGEMATEVMEAKFKEFRNEKHKAQWQQTINFYAKPLLKKVVSEIDTADILKVLKPIWDTKPETASRLRGRIETILNAAKAKGMRFGENPALWKGQFNLNLRS